MGFDPLKFWEHLIHHPPERQLFTYETVGSTNTVLHEHLEKGATPGAVVIAAQQTAGRGQRSRSWVSPIGGLYMSVAIAPNLPASQTARLTMASAWGIAAGLRRHQVPVRLKWPNDLYLDQKKLGGILTETSVQGSQVYRAIVGIGLNWRNAPPPNGIALSHPSVTLNPPLTSLETLAALVMDGVTAGQRSLMDQGLTAIRHDYHQWLYQPLPAHMSWDSL
ncbi:MAG: biotin--[acetyl-CoA-carboxylase] ligase [Cyanobacteria bacterium P01_F01_bin.42]